MVLQTDRSIAGGSTSRKAALPENNKKLRMLATISILYRKALLLFEDIVSLLTFSDASFFSPTLSGTRMGRSAGKFPGNF